MAALTIELDRSTLQTVIGALADKQAVLRRYAASFRAAHNLADVARLERVLQQLESERTRLAHSRYLK